MPPSGGGGRMKGLVSIRASGRGSAGLRWMAWCDSNPGRGRGQQDTIPMAPLIPEDERHSYLLVLLVFITLSQVAYMASKTASVSSSLLGNRPMLGYNKN